MTVWMLSAVVFALLVAVAARAGEEALRAYRRPLRVLWLSALVASVTAPFAVRLANTLWPGLLSGGRVGVAGMSVMLGDVVRSTSAPMGAASVGWSVTAIDEMAVVVWLALSLGVLSWFCWVWRQLGRARGAWRAGQLAEHAVLFSRQTGPAVIGLRHPAIVLPAWVLAESAAVQRMILRHENEHARAGDHVLLALVPLLLVAMPWNLPLWWQARRLRLAIELDCDARVLRSGVPAHDYGSLLLELAAQRRSLAVPGAMLAEPRTFLERRILALSSPPARPAHLRAAIAAGVALVAGLAACQAVTMPDNTPQDAETAVETAVAPAPPVSGPIYVVDGQRIRRGHEPQMNDSDVTRVEILKGAEAAARYGPDGTDGVIVVTTRSGRTVPARPAPSVTAADTARNPNAIEVTGAEVRGRFDGSTTTITGTELELRPAEQSGAKAPLFLIDGRVSTATELRALGTDRIESIEVIKGAAAGALYGERARNGVIIVTTRGSG